ncbi:hypothetical protein Misp01_41460 [Microtetraspora sp. NBRC 13810]|nr:hypothetical protein Misp01_41460 [Microtetraspora sp. NBRC 13810]
MRRLPVVLDVLDVRLCTGGRRRVEPLPGRGVQPRQVAHPRPYGKAVRGRGLPRPGAHVFPLERELGMGGQPMAGRREAVRLVLRGGPGRPLGSIPHGRIVPPI